MKNKGELVALADDYGKWKGGEEQVVSELPVASHVAILKDTEKSQEMMVINNSSRPANKKKCSNKNSLWSGWSCPPSTAASSAASNSDPIKPHPHSVSSQYCSHKENVRLLLFAFLDK
ncbi:hypothetical protein GOP47_0028831 [Adiantum capillus-veneris]|nr:hypothetical protein GOP47_0028831 [Adiantum capillus-veneris]